MNARIHPFTCPPKATSNFLSKQTVTLITIVSCFLRETEEYRQVCCGNRIKIKKKVQSVEAQWFTGKVPKDFRNWHS